MSGSCDVCGQADCDCPSPEDAAFDQRLADIQLAWGVALEEVAMAACDMRDALHAVGGGKGVIGYVERFDAARARMDKLKAQLLEILAGANPVDTSRPPR